MKQIAILLLMWSLEATAQEQDSLYFAAGTITNSVTKEPVNARIRYHSLPYGIITGVLNGSSFRFALLNNFEHYAVAVSAPGFIEAKTVLGPHQANSNRVTEWNVELVPAGAHSLTVGSLQSLNNLIFETGTSQINSSSFGSLDQVVAKLKESPSMVIQLEGHTDTQGKPEKNLQLSEERVKAVRRYLLSKGVSKNQVRTQAFGGTQPLSHENTEEAHRLNRRVEVRVLSE